MCVEIHIVGINQELKREIGTLGELRDYLDGTPIIYYEPDGELTMDKAGPENCLCGVDIDATLQSDGLATEWPDHRMYCNAIEPFG